MQILSLQKLRNLFKKIYIIANFLFIIWKIKLINKHNFAKIILDKNLKTFVIYITILKTFAIIIYLFWTNQIATL